MYITQLRAFGVAVTLLVLSACQASAAVTGLFWSDQIVNRDTRQVWSMLRRKTYTYPVTVVSNIPENTVMPAVCREAMQREDDGTPHCTYCPLSQVGGFGKGGHDLLPDPVLNRETVLVVDRSTLTLAEKAELKRITQELFASGISQTGPRDVRVWLQNQETQTFQAWIDLPDANWLAETCNDLWALPAGFIEDNSHGSRVISHTIMNVAVLTNDEEARQTLHGGMHYSVVKCYTVDEAQAFRAAAGADRRVVALNWNASEEVPPATAAQLLPPELAAACNETTGTDGMGLTGWQRFCRRAFAEQYRLDGTDYWVIAAPTAAFLHELMAHVLSGNFAQNRYDVALLDLGNIRRLAVAVLPSPAVADRLHLPQEEQLDQAAAKTLKCSVVTTPDGWQRRVDALGDTDTGAATLANLAGADAVLLIRLDRLEGTVTHEMDCVRITPPFPPFTAVEPVEPPMPDYNAQVPDSNSPHYVYPGATEDARRHSDQYVKDYADWHDHQEPDYQQRHDRWQHDHDTWVFNRQHYRVEYTYTLNAIPRVIMGGTIEIVDRAPGDPALWQVPLDVTGVGNPHARVAVPVVVYGEDTAPTPPTIVYRDTVVWGESAALVGTDTLEGLAQDTLTDTLAKSVKQMTGTVLWYSDLQPWNRANE